VTQTYSIKSTIAYYEHSKLPIIIPALDIGQPFGELLAMVPNNK
jgi:hypothetical protein